MPVYIVQDPTGRRHRVTAPEGVSQNEVLERAINELRPSPPPRLSPPPRPFSTQPNLVTDPTTTAGPAVDLAAGPAVDPTAFDEERDPTRPDYGFLSSGVRGIRRGATRLSSTAADLLPALGASTIASIAETVGADNAAEALRDYATEQINENMATEEAIAANNPAEFQSYKEVAGVGDAVKFGLQVVGEQVPNLLGIIGTGGIGSAVAKKTAEKQAKKLVDKRVKELKDKGADKDKIDFRNNVSGQKLIKQVGEKAAKKALYASTFMGSYALNAPEVFNNIYERTGTFAPGTSLLAGAVAASLDSILPYQVSKAISQNPLLRQEVVKKVLERSGAKPSVLRGLAWGTGKAGALEGVTEGGQEAISILAERIVGENWEALSSDEMDRIVESMVQGSVGGGPFGGISSAYESSRAKKALREADEERKYLENLAYQEQIDPEVRKLDSKLTDIENQIANETDPETIIDLQKQKEETQAELNTLSSPTEQLRREEEGRPLDEEGRTLADIAEEEGPEGVSAQVNLEVEQLQEVVAELEARLEDPATQADAENIRKVRRQLDDAKEKLAEKDLYTRWEKIPEQYRKETPGGFTSVEQAERVEKEVEQKIAIDEASELPALITAILGGKKAPQTGEIADRIKELFAYANKNKSLSLLDEEQRAEIKRLLNTTFADESLSPDINARLDHAIANNPYLQGSVKAPEPIKATTEDVVDTLLDQEAKDTDDPLDQAIQDADDPITVARKKARQDMKARGELAIFDRERDDMALTIGRNLGPEAEAAYREEAQKIADKNFDNYQAKKGKPKTKSDATKTERNVAARYEALTEEQKNKLEELTGLSRSEGALGTPDLVYAILNAEKMGLDNQFERFINKIEADALKTKPDAKSDVKKEETDAKTTGFGFKSPFTQKAWNNRANRKQNDINDLTDEDIAEFLPKGVNINKLTVPDLKAIAKAKRDQTKKAPETKTAKAVQDFIKKVGKLEETIATKKVEKEAKAKAVKLAERDIQKARSAGAGYYGTVIPSTIGEIKSEYGTDSPAVEAYLNRLKQAREEVRPETVAALKKAEQDRKDEIAARDAEEVEYGGETFTRGELRKARQAVAAQAEIQQQKRKEDAALAEVGAEIEAKQQELAKAVKSKQGSLAYIKNRLGFELSPEQEKVIDDSLMVEKGATPKGSSRPKERRKVIEKIIANPPKEDKDYTNKKALLDSLESEGIEIAPSPPAKRLELAERAMTAEEGEIALTLDDFKNQKNDDTALRRPKTKGVIKPSSEAGWTKQDIKDLKKAKYKKEQADKEAIAKQRRQTGTRKGTKVVDVPEGVKQRPLKTIQKTTKQRLDREFKELIGDVDSASSIDNVPFNVTKQGTRTQAIAQTKLRLQFFVEKNPEYAEAANQALINGLNSRAKRDAQITPEQQKLINLQAKQASQYAEAVTNPPSQSIEAIDKRIEELKKLQLQTLSTSDQRFNAIKKAFEKSKKPKIADPDSDIDATQEVVTDLKKLSGEQESLEIAGQDVNLETQNTEADLNEQIQSLEQDKADLEAQAITNDTLASYQQSKDFPNLKQDVKTLTDINGEIGKTKAILSNREDEALQKTLDNLREERNAILEKEEYIPIITFRDSTQIDGSVKLDLRNDIIEEKNSVSPVVPTKPTTVKKIKDAITEAFNTTEAALEKANIKFVKNPKEAGLEEDAPQVYTKGTVTKDGTIYLFTDNIQEGDELSVFLHEVGSHVGMKNLVGSGNYNFYIKKIKQWAKQNPAGKNSSPEVIIANRAAARVEFAQEVGTAKPDDELLAYFIEEAVNDGYTPDLKPNEIPSYERPVVTFMKRVFAGIKNAMGRLGLPVTLTAQDLVDLAYGAAGDVIRGNSARTNETVIEQTSDPLKAERIFDKFIWGARDTALKVSPDFTKPAIGKTIEVIERSEKFSSSFVTKTLSYFQLADSLKYKAERAKGETGKVINRLADNILTLDKQLKKRKSQIDELRKRIAKSIYDGQKILQKHAKYAEEFNDIAYDSTIDEIDLTDVNNPAVVQSELFKRYKKLPPELQLLYRNMVNTYRKYAQAHIDKMVELAIQGGAGKKSDLVNTLRAQKSRINPYLPLYRSGDFWINYEIEGTEGRVKEAFPTRSAAQMAIKERQKRGAYNFATIYNRQTGNLKAENPAMTAEFNKVIGQLRDLRSKDKTKKNIPDDTPHALDGVIESVQETYLSMFPSDSVKQQFKVRKKTPGFRKNVLADFADVGYKLASEQALMNSQKGIDDAFGAIEKTAQEAQGAATIDTTGVVDETPGYTALSEKVMDRLNADRKNIYNPFPAPWAANMSYLGYQWYLMGNISASAINFSQIPIIAFPMMAVKYGPVKASKVLMESYANYFMGGQDDNTNLDLGIPDTDIAIPLADWTAFKDAKGELKELYDTAVDQQAVRIATGQEITDVKYSQKALSILPDSISDPVGSPTGTWSRAEYALNWLFQNSERGNREITLIAAFKLEKDRLLKQGKDSKTATKEAIQEAIDFVETVNGPAITEVGPTWFRDSWGKVIGTFKKFPLSQFYLQYKLLRQAIAPLDKESRAVAIGQYAAINASLFSVAGVMGVPVYGLIEMLHDLVWEDDPAEELEMKAVRFLGADYAYGWLPNLMNMDIAHRVTWRGLLIRDNDYRISQIGYPLYLLETLAGPAFSVTKTPVENIHKVWNGEMDTKTAVTLSLPSAFKNLIQAYDLVNKGAVNRKGDLVNTNISDWTAFNKAIGFADAETALLKRTFNLMKGVERDMAFQKRKIFQEYTLAQINGDTKRMREIRDVDIPEYNSRKLARYGTWAISSYDLRRSADARMKAMELSFSGISLSDATYEVLGKELPFKNFLDLKHMDQYLQQF